jgi:hypothetical protein
MTMQEDEQFDQTLQEWLEPDHATVERIAASAFDTAARREAAGRERWHRGSRFAPRAWTPLLVTAGVVMLVVGAVVVFRLAHPTPGGARPTPIDPGVARVPRQTQPSAQAVIGLSDGNVMVIHLPDGSNWIGTVSRTAVRSQTGTGHVVLEGGEQ